MLATKSVSLANRLSDISITFRPQSVTHLIGPNGSGKSSLLAALSGLTPIEGEVRWENQLITSWSSSELATYRAYLPQSSSPQFDMRVFQYLNTIISQLYPQSHRNYQEAVMSLDQQLHIMPLFEKKVSELSGGEWQRIRLTSFFLQVWPSLNPHGKFALLDEPLTGLDLLHQQNVMRLITNIAKAGMAVIVANHDINDTLRYADEVVVVNGGTIDSYGTPDQQLSPSMLARVFNVEARIVTLEDRNMLVW